MKQEFAVSRFVWVSICAVFVTLCTLGCAFATGAGDGNDDTGGVLNLNTNVLINDSEGTGSAGDFVIRGTLFSAEFSERMQEQRKAVSDLLARADTLDFAHNATSAFDYRPVRSALFEHYSSQEVPRSAQEHTGKSSVFFGVVVVVVPLVMVAGVLLGRFWARRKRVAS